MQSRLIIVILFLLIITVAVEAKELAVVVNKTNPVEDLSLKDLIKIFRSERQYWDGERVHILMRESGSWEKEVILKKIYQMTDEDLNKFWLGKIFRGEITTFPTIFGSEVMVKKLVNNVAGAISFIDSQIADDKVKMIRIEGKLPGEEGYILRNNGKSQ